MIQTTATKQKTETGIFALFKGHPGAGKSVEAFGFPKPFVFDFDVKMPSVANKHYPGKEFAWESFDNILQVSDRLEEFTKNCPYETLIFDSITSLVQLIFSTVATWKGESVLKPKKAKDGSILPYSLDYYSQETRFIQEFLFPKTHQLWYRQGNPKHVIFTAHLLSTESQNMITNVTTKTSSIVTQGKKVATFILSKFDNSWHFTYDRPEMGQIQGSRVCYTSLVGEDDARCNLDLPSKIVLGKESIYEMLKKKGIVE